MEVFYAVCLMRFVREKPLQKVSHTFLAFHGLPKARRLYVHRTYSLHLYLRILTFHNLTICIMLPKSSLTPLTTPRPQFPGLSRPTLH